MQQPKSATSTPLRGYTRYKRIQTLIQNYMRHVRTESAREQKQRYIRAMNNAWQHSRSCFRYFQTSIFAKSEKWREKLRWAYSLIKKIYFIFYYYYSIPVEFPWGFGSPLTCSLSFSLYKARKVRCEPQNLKRPVSLDYQPALSTNPHHHRQLPPSPLLPSPCLASPPVTPPTPTPLSYPSLRSWTLSLFGQQCFVYRGTSCLWSVSTYQELAVSKPALSEKTGL